MKGVVFGGERTLELMSFPDPTPGPGEVVLEIKASGMCGSDLKFYRAPKSGGTAKLGLGALKGPVIAGHEPCGVVAALGPGVAERQAPLGARVMVHHYSGCGVCPHCRSGWAQLCQEGPIVYGVTGHGAHAPYMKVPASTLVALPDELGFDTGAAISCGTGTAYGALQRMKLSGRDRIAIFGQGPVGLSATQLASAMGARVIALDVSPERLARAKEFGAEAIVDPGSNDPVPAIKEWTHGTGADLALDTSGAPSARLAAVQCARTWGTVCFVGEGDTVTLDVSRDLLRRQLTLIGSWTFSTVGQAECARFIAERGIATDRLFTHRWRLEEAEEAYRLFDAQTAGKGVFLM
ncbi:MAG TPA: zinc-binding dehydrogenase [Alphaproteobacteria bacterium]|nr:zinc-binding dehydrogenase [Alphaproteobacteria bacterium]